VRMENQRVWLSDALSISAENTNLPFEDMTFRSNIAIYWLVKMCSYEQQSGMLKVEVISYQHSGEGFSAQTQKKPVKALQFARLNWDELEPQLISYRMGKVKHLLATMPSTHHSEMAHATLPTMKSLDASTQTIQLEKTVSFSDVQFTQGFVVFTMYVHELFNDVTISIANPHILAEFDPIKFWFAKALKTKTFDVRVWIEYNKYHEVVQMRANSVVIAQITSDLIETVKYQRTLSIAKPPVISNPDKSLFTPDEVFDSFADDDSSGNLFHQTEEEILRSFLEKSNLRNRSQLIYLSGKMQSERQKLRYTLHPHFGFLFFVEGQQQHHFIWELLNSHATYIWSFNKQSSIDLQYQKVEETIAQVRTLGREKYRTAWRHAPLDDMVFWVIHHDHANSKFVDGFAKWKARIEEGLV